jgi:hypothetical protein
VFVGVDDVPAERTEERPGHPPSRVPKITSAVATCVTCDSPTSVPRPVTMVATPAANHASYARIPLQSSVESAT